MLDIELIVQVFRFQPVTIILALPSIIIYFAWYFTFALDLKIKDVEDCI